MRRNPDASVPSGAEKTQYPLMKYLSLLLAVTLLFSGVTFARYLTGGSVYSSVGIAAFDATYSIDRINATSFGNQAYWIETGNSGYVPQGENTAITVGITLKNNGDTEVHPTLHLEGPADYWDNIALQFSTSRNIAVETVLSPQFVIADLVKERKVIEEDDPNYGKEHYIEYGDYKTWDNEPWLTGEPSEDTGEGSEGSGEGSEGSGEGSEGSGEGSEGSGEGSEGSGETPENEIGYSDDFDPLGDVTAQLTLNGGLTENEDGTVEGSVTATWGESNENTLTISAKEETRDYSVGFVREDDNGLLSPIYVDCRKEMTIYSIDIDLAALKVAAKQGEGASTQPIVVWLTWTNAAPNNSQAAKEDFWTQLAQGESFKIESNGDEIDITGYHFDVSGIPVTDASGEPVTDENGNPTGETTTVRVKQTFGGTAEYFHVETLEGDDGAYAHPLMKVEGQENIYKCDNADPVYVSLKDIDGTFAGNDVNMIRYETDQQANITYAPIQQRAFGVRFSATFVQSSERP